MVDWAIADLHLGHAKCVTEFTRDDGSPLRDFKDVDEMNETIIKNIIDTVGPYDTLFVLGDTVINKKFIPLMDQIADAVGRLYLIGGNHDVHHKELSEVYDKIYGCLEYNKCILTHIPVHPQQKQRFKANVHGHLHWHTVKHVSYDTTVGKTGVTSSIVDDPWYVNVSCERVNYTPVNLRELTDAAINRIS